MGENAVLEAIGASVTRARNHTDDVQFSPEDATRTVPDFLCRAAEVAIHFRRHDDQYSRHGGLFDAAGISSTSSPCRPGCRTPTK